MGIRLKAEFAGVDWDLHDDVPLGEHSETDENFEINGIEKGNFGTSSIESKRKSNLETKIDVEVYN